MPATAYRSASVIATLAVYSAMPLEASTLYLSAGDNLQDALNAAQPGDTILLEEGAEFVGNFVLPVKAGEGWITLRSAAPDTVLPASGVRISPSDAPLLARLRSPNSSPVLRTAARAHHWDIRYLELAPNLDGYGDIVQIGDGSSAQVTLDMVPHHFVLNHLYLHGDPAYGQKRGISLNAAHVTISDSYIAECKGVGQDTQAIAGWNGPGPYTIENNYLEASGENVLFGGADPAIAALVADGITIRHNYFSRPLSWRNPLIAMPQDVTATAEAGGSLPAGEYAYRVVAKRPLGRGTTGRSTASTEARVTTRGTGAVGVRWSPVEGASEYCVYGRTAAAEGTCWCVSSPGFVDTGAAGTPEPVPTTPGTVWSVKNLFELKNARNVAIEGNIFENHWKESQSGYAIVFTPRNSGGACTWCVVENVRFEYNLVRNVAAGVNLLGYDLASRPTHQTVNIAFRRNLFWAVKTTLGGNAWFMLVGDEPRTLIVEHNTFDGNGNAMMYTYGGTATDPREVYGLEMTANAARHSSYGFNGAYFTYGNGILAGFYPDAVFSANYLAGGSASRYPAGTVVSGVFEDQFVNPSVGDFTLRSASILKGAAPDGTDIGVDYPQLLARLAGVESGIVTPVVPPPTGPTAGFSASCDFLRCTFRDASLSGSSPIGSWSWDFGDGAVGAGAQVVHSYAATGSFTVRLTVRDANGLTSSATEALTVQAPPPAAADLVETVVSASTACAAPGSSFVVTDTVHNQGSVKAAITVTRFYLSLDPLKGSSDRRLTNTRDVPELGAGASSSGSTPVKVPSSMPVGTYTLLACADDRTDVAEGDETNNCTASVTTVIVTRPDLVGVTTGGLPSFVVPGTAVRVTDTVKNQSLVEAGASSTRYYLSVDGVKSSGDTLLTGKRSVPVLAAGASSAGTAHAGVPADAPDGTYRVLACHDDLARLVEASESNNCAGSPTTVLVGWPDLVMTGISNPPSSMAPGAAYSLSHTVMNQGTVPSADTYTRYYLSVDGMSGPGAVQLTGKVPVVGLGARASSTGSSSVTVPLGTPSGSYFVLGCADDTQRVDESEEGNNCRFSLSRVAVGR